MNFIAKALMVAISDMLLTSKSVEEASRRITSIGKVEGVAESLLVRSVLDVIRIAETVEEAYGRITKIANIGTVVLEPLNKETQKVPVMDAAPAAEFKGDNDEEFFKDIIRETVRETLKERNRDEMNMNYVVYALLLSIADILLSSKNVDEASRRIISIGKVEGVAESLLLKAVLDVIRASESIEDAYRRVAKIANVETVLLEPLKA